MFPTAPARDRSNLPPAVVVHGLDQACAALVPGLAVTLLSAPAAARFAGAGWWRALVAAARATHPATPCADVLDCADAPGRAMEAIRIGQRILVLDPACPAFARVASLATVLPDRPPALNLGARGASLRLRDWLGAAPEDDRPAPLR
jgi:hypothetical protein